MPSPNVLFIDDMSFDAEVLGSPIPFLLDITATWCGPCKALSPVIDRLADAHVGRVRVGKLDIDQATATATRLGVRGAPTVVAFRDGKEVGRRVGLSSADKLLALLAQGAG